MQRRLSIITLLLALSAICFIHECHCQSLTDANALLTDALDGYNKILRPVENQGEPLVLYVGFELISIKDVDEVTQTVTVNGLFALNWVDVSMKWKPDEYGELYHIFVENDQFWTPTLVLTTSDGKRKKIGDTWLGIRYEHTGVAHYWPGDLFGSACTMDIAYFPFDQHECVLSFTAWGQIPEEVYIYNTSDKAQTNHFSPNGAWEFVDSEVSVVRVPGSSTHYNVKLVIRRLPRYVILNIVVPLIFLSMLNLLVFFIPTDSGERISFCITLLLAIAVFLTIISDNLPKTSFPMSIFSYYLLAVLIISNCITLAIIFGLTLYFTDTSKPINCFWKCLALTMSCKCFGRRGLAGADDNNTQGGNKVHPQENVKESENIEKKMEMVDVDNVWLSKNNVHLTDTNAVSDDNGAVCWKDVSVAFDRLCFVFFSFTLFVTTTTVFAIIISQGSYEQSSNASSSA